MSLEAIQPMSYQQFVNTLGDTVGQVIAVLENHQRGGWWNALQRYQYNGIGYIAGQNIRNQFHQQLVNAVVLNDRIDVANNILQWGEMLPLNQQMQDNLELSLFLLNDEMNGDLNQIFAGRIASTSKIYEMWNPAAWVIYDSYCAKGLQWLISQFWNQNGNETHANILRYPWPPGRIGAPMNGFPRLGTPRQARLGFIYASWLCRAIAEQLNENGNQMLVWQAYHIEMVAFQIGHEV